MRMPFEERLGGDVKRVEQDLMSAKQAAVKPAGLTVPQYAALFLLAESPGISSAGLARGCRVTPQTMTTIVRNLEARGLIERSPHPWHHNVIETRPTPAGIAALDVADERAAAVERKLADEFTATERQTLRDLLGRCSKVLAAEAERLGQRP